MPETIYERLTIRADQLRTTDVVHLGDVPVFVPVPGDEGTWKWARGNVERVWRYVYTPIPGGNEELAEWEEQQAMVDALSEHFVFLRLADDTPTYTGSDAEDVNVAVHEDQLVDVQRVIRPTTPEAMLGRLDAPVLGPKIEVLHERDPDSSCDISVYLDGVLARTTEQSVDPGAGGSRADWAQHTANVEADETLTPAYRAASVEALNRHADSQYLDDLGYDLDDEEG